eukprot:CAMPEP_0205850162 /NCGR_PEP_ID=MMETSP1019-20131125/77419_1 /ASSEMBLY_ACC=CAM_ASM_000403 /TAXON_ID=46462 /ORGANISM="Anophryoides haemophila, Strain AH6" /LENGTH=36 /DNA_ID= /DNA_START= /DNA_END= /DNA_ORIENTATION=
MNLRPAADDHVEMIRQILDFFDGRRQPHLHTRKPHL